MYTPREKVLWFSVLSRLAVILLQFVFNNLCPDHNADAFRTPRGAAEQVSVYDKAVDALLGGLTKWDSQYFIHIAKYGYTYENTLAFFPLYPMSVRCVAIVLKKVLFVLNDHSAATVAAVLINFVCFVKSTLILYDLSKKVLGSTNTAYKAAILYCVNPASIFFSAAYSESMFAYLTFYSMLASLENHRFVCFPIGLSGLVRSNGLVNIGFPAFAWLQNWIFVVFPKVLHEYRHRFIKKALAVALTRTLVSSIKLLNTMFLSLVPFVLLQIYIYVSFCTKHSRAVVLPDHVTLLAVENGLSMPGSSSLSWCHEGLPLAYSKIQAKYWNVGFLKYYELKQIPNFILASPILFVMLKCIFQYFSEHKHILYNCRERQSKAGSQTVHLTRLPVQTFVFIVHGLFLTLFCILFVHIQVSTRLLASASPLLYWYCASAMSSGGRSTDKLNEEYEDRNNAFSRWKVFFMVQKRYTLADVLILMYFLGYLILGCFMHSNYLPWT